MEVNIIELLILSLIIVFFFNELINTKNYVKTFGSITLTLILFLSIYCNDYYIIFFSLDYWRLFICLLVIMLFLLILNILEEKTFDIYLLTILVLFGSLIIITCDHLLIIYLGLELQTFSMFVLISKNRISIKSSEAGLKYFILGALSSGIYLLGLCFLFLSGISFNIKALLFSSNEFLVIISMLLMLLSLVFKLALAPLHFWIPDIYEGSSWDIISLLSTLPKISVLVLILQLGFDLNLLLACSLGSIIIGTFGAFNQSKLKRLLAYSGISHIGFIMLGYNLFVIEGYEIGYLYLIIYMITMISVFFMIIMTPLNKNYFVVELSGLQYVNRTLSLTWLLMFLSIAGIPPLSGFISKWFVLWNLINHNYIISSLIGIIFSAVGTAYYLRIIKIVYFQKQASYLTWNKILTKNPKFNGNSYFILGFGVFFTILLIINPNPLIGFVYFLFIHLY